ncbi:MAG: 30S ribosomal protein S16 [Alphaproteobacteria bacterium]|nr:30S ribosomal protein S16 [Alphaproteobacteria bacterium]
MALKVRLARRGRKNLPIYSIVVTDSRNPRDGKFLEKVGTYNPLVKKDDPARVSINTERVSYWLKQGAKPSDRVATFLGKAGLIAMPAQKNNPEKAKPKAKAQERLKEQEERRLAAEEAAKAEKEAANAPAPAAAEELAPAEAEAAPEAAAEETPAAE